MCKPVPEIVKEPSDLLRAKVQQQASVIASCTLKLPDAKSDLLQTSPRAPASCKRDI